MRNKLLYLTIFLVSVNIFSIQAQRQPHRFGFRMGLNYSDIDFDDDSILPGGDGSARYGFMAGFFAIYNLSEKISIQPEIQYSAQGEKSSSTLDFSGTQGQFSEDPLKLNLIQVPVLFNYTINDKFVFSIGPQVGLRVWEWERRRDYETIQFSGVAGVGYNLTDNWSINLRGSFGVTNAIDADNSNSFEVTNTDIAAPIFKAEGVNHYLQFSVAYSL